MRCDAQGVGRPFPGMLPAQVQHMLTPQNSTANPQHLKKMQPSAAGTQMRISSGSGMQPPTMSAANSQQHQSSPSQPLPPSQSQSTQPQSNTVSPIINHSPPAPSTICLAECQNAVTPTLLQHAIGLPSLMV